MSIVQPNTVDFVASKPDSNTVHLVISDHLGWENEGDHLVALQSKLNTYLEFVECGQLLRDFPEHSGKAVKLEIAFLHAPNPQVVERFLLPASKAAHTYGVDLSWKTSLGAT